MFWIRGLFILVLCTLTIAQNIFFGSFSGLKVKPLQVYPRFQYSPQVKAQGSDDVAQEPTYPNQPLFAIIDTFSGSTCQA